jgi:AcrR family transcriptional regulator
VDIVIDRKKRNEEILFACADVFYEKGIEKATMRNFSEATGYSPATIYQSFQDKREIVENCLSFCVEKRNNMLADVIEKNKTAPDKIFRSLQRKERELMKWTVVIVRIITSPYYRDEHGNLDEVNMSAIEKYENVFEEELLILFMLYYAALNYYVISGNEAYFRKEEKFIEAEIAKRI